MGGWGDGKCESTGVRGVTLPDFAQIRIPGPLRFRIGGMDRQTERGLSALTALSALSARFVRCARRDTI